MFGIGVPEIISILVIGFVVVGTALARRGEIRITGPKLVLRRFNIDETTETNVFVDIAGRASGVIAWILTVIGFDAETSLTVTDKEVTFKSSSLFGQTYRVVPLPNVSSTSCGYSKPIGYLIFGILSVIIAIFAGVGLGSEGGWIVLFGLLISAGFLVAYYLSKTTVISLETSGGSTFGLAFKRSVIENVSVEMEQALKAIRLINQNTVESQTK